MTRDAIINQVVQSMRPAGKRGTSDAMLSPMWDGELTCSAMDEEFVRYEAAHASSKVKFVESFDFYCGRQWEAGIAADLINRGQFPLVINKVYPAIQNLLSFLTANMPQYIYSPTQGQYLGLSDAHNHVGRYTWERSKGSRNFTRLVLDTIVGGYAWAQVYVDAISKEPRWKRNNPLDVFPDPASEDPLCDDASSIFIRRLTTPRALMRIWPEYAEVIMSAPTMTRKVYSNSFKYQSNTSALQMSSSRILSASGDPYRREDISLQETLICALERYSKVIRTEFELIHRLSGSSYKIEPDKLAEVLGQLTNIEDFAVSPTYTERIRQTNHIYGTSTLLQDLTYDMREYPIIPLFDNHMDNPMAEGEVEHLKGLSMERNKRRSMMIHNATTSSNSKWLVEDGSTAPGEFEKKSSIPGAVMYYRRGYSKPEPVFPMPMPEVLHYLEQQADNDIQEVSGMWSMMSGDPSQAPNTWHGIMEMDEHGGRRPAIKQRQLDDMLSQLGQVVLKFNQIYMRGERVVRLVEPTEGSEAILINSFDPQSGSVFNDISAGDWTVFCKSSSTLPTNRNAKLSRALELKREGVYDEEAVLKLVDDPEASKVLQRRNRLAQAVQQVQQLAGERQEMVGQLKNLEQTITHLQRELAKEKATKDIEIRTNEVKAKLGALIRVAEQSVSLRSKEAAIDIGAMRRQSVLDNEERNLAAERTRFADEQAMEEMGMQVRQTLAGRQTQADTEEGSM